MKTSPLVSIIIVNYNGQKLLETCLSSLQQLIFPKKQLQIIVVDNNSTDNSSSYVKKSFPEVELIQANENLGFTGGNNLGYRHAHGQYIVLLNSDTRVDKLWLKNLLKAARPKEVGIVSSKLLFDQPFLKINIISKTIPHSEIDHSTDFSPRGIIMGNVICKPNLSHLVWYKSGFYPLKQAEITTRWTDGHAELLMPFTGKTTTYKFFFHGYPSQFDLSTPVQIKLGNQILAETSLKSEQIKQIEVQLSAAKIKRHLHWLIQSAGNIVLSDGYGKDRGSVVRNMNSSPQEFYEEQTPQLNKPTKVLAANGAAVLIKRKVIDEVGFFDGYYYMYYEDLDFSLRAWKRGWDIVYEPKAVVYHKHKATTGKKESIFLVFMIEKNHLAFVLTHFPIKTVIKELVNFILRVAITLTKALLFKMRDNLIRSNAWQIKASGRMTAFKTIVIQLPRIWRKRLFWQTREKRNWNEMKKFVY